MSHSLCLQRWLAAAAGLQLAQLPPSSWLRILSILYFMTGCPVRVFLKNCCLAWRRCFCRVAAAGQGQHVRGRELPMLVTGAGKLWLYHQHVQSA